MNATQQKRTPEQEAMVTAMWELRLLRDLWTRRTAKRQAVTRTDVKRVVRP